MALYLYAGFDVDALASDPAWTVTDSGGFSAVTVSSGTYSHVDLSSVAIGYTDFAAALQTALNATGVLNGTYTVVYNKASQTYTISCTESFSISENATARTLTGDFPSGSATSHTSTTPADYVIEGAAGKRCGDVEPHYEPDDMFTGGEADDGTPYGVSRTTGISYEDFRCDGEPEARVFKGKKVAATGYTFQEFYEHARGEYPIAVEDDSEIVVGYLRAPASFGLRTRQRMMAGYDGYWNVAIAQNVRGRI